MPNRGDTSGHNNNTVFTLPETNTAPENRPLEKGIPTGNHHFKVRTVSFREGNSRTVTEHRYLNQDFIGYAQRTGFHHIAPVLVVIQCL